MAKEKQSFQEKLKDLEKKFGVGSIINGSDVADSLEVINSGSMSLDLATNIGGIPVGKLIELLGMESSGKSTLTLEIIANFQKAGKKCVLVDFEQSFDKKYATSIGVKVNELLICSPESQEDGYNLIQGLIETGEVGLVVIDSHTAGMPKKVVEGDVGDATIGLQARINSTALGKIKPILLSNHCTVIGISQIRQNIGSYGDPNVTTGGLAWKFYSDMRFKVSKSVDKVAENNKTTVEIIKNKCGSPFGKAEFLINWGEGIDEMQEIIDFAVELGKIQKGGAGWFTIGDTKLQGAEKVKQFFSDNPEFYQEMRTEIFSELKPNKLEKQEHGI